MIFVPFFRHGLTYFFDLFFWKNFGGWSFFFISKSDLDLSLLSKKLWQQSTLLHYCKTSPYPEIFKKKHIMRNSKGALKKIFNSIMSFECKYKTRNYQFSSAKLEEKQTIYFLSHGHKSQQLSFCWPKS